MGISLSPGSGGGADEPGLVVTPPVLKQTSQTWNVPS